jgi:UDP-3-O-[3-hydroxymyristoyl] glucosamine N-acyltransferase
MKLIIYGVKKTAKKIANIIYKNKNFTIAGFIGNEKEKSELYGKKVFKNFFFLGSINDIAQLKLENAKLYAVNAVSKSCVLHPNVILGKGVIIEDGVRIKKNTIIGNNCLIQKGTNIEENVIVNHNCIIGENVKIANGVLLSRGCLLKNNSSILQRVFIGKNQVIEKNSKINIDLANKYKKDYCE